MDGRSWGSFMIPMQSQFLLDGLMVMNPHTEDDTVVAAILLGKLSPDTLELGVGWATLSNDAIVPTCVVVLQIL